MDKVIATTTRPAGLTNQWTSSRPQAFACSVRYDASYVARRADACDRLGLNHAD